MLLDVACLDLLNLFNNQHVMPLPHASGGFVRPVPSAACFHWLHEAPDLQSALDEVRECERARIRNSVC
eukprot:5068131-Amphidinium_carterae.3